MLLSSLFVILFLASVRVIEGGDLDLSGGLAGILKGPARGTICSSFVYPASCFQATCPTGEECYSVLNAPCECRPCECCKVNPGNDCSLAQCSDPDKFCTKMAKNCACKKCSEMNSEKCSDAKCPEENKICKRDSSTSSCSCQIKQCSDYSGASISDCSDKPACSATTKCSWVSGTKCTCVEKTCPDYTGASISDCSNKPTCSATTKCTWLSGPQCTCVEKTCPDYTGASISDCSNKPACSATTKCTWLSGPQCTCVDKTCSDYTDPSVCSTQPDCSPTHKCAWNCFDSCDCTLKTCSDYTDPALCSTQTDCSTNQKCSWNGLDSCDCTFKTCSDYTDPALCSAQPDCSPTHKCAWNGVNRCDCTKKTCTDYTDPTVCSAQPDCSTTHKCDWKGADNRCACTIKQCTELTTEADCANGPGCSPTTHQCTWNGNRCNCLELGCLHADDVILTVVDDVQYTVPFETKFLGTLYPQVKFTSNGVLHFGNTIAYNSLTSPNPCGSNNLGPLLSFYWGDGKPGTGSPAAKVCYRIIEDPQGQNQDLTNAKNTIVNAWPTLSDITLTKAIYIHLEAFTYFGAPPPSTCCPGNSLRNSYQIILATNNGDEHFLLLWYKNILWGGSQSNICFGKTFATQTAIDDGTTATKISPKSCTAQIIQIDEDTNINHGLGNTGKFAFKVSGPTPIPPDA